MVTSVSPAVQPTLPEPELPSLYAPAVHPMPRRPVADQRQLGPGPGQLIVLTSQRICSAAPRAIAATTICSPVCVEFLVRFHCRCPRLTAIGRRLRTYGSAFSREKCHPADWGTFSGNSTATLRSHRGRVSNRREIGLFLPIRLFQETVQSLLRSVPWQRTIEVGRETVTR